MNSIDIIQKLNVILESGKIDDSQLKSLDKQLTDVVLRTLQKLPGGDAIVQQKIKIDPKLDTKDLTSKLKSTLGDIYKEAEKRPEIIQTKGFLEAEKSVLKFTSALEKLEQVQSRSKFSKPFLKNVQDATAGKMDVDKLNRRELERYKAYLQELSSTWSQIQREFGKVRDIRNVTRPIKDETGRVEITQTAENIGAKLVADLRKSNNKMQESIKQVDGLLKQREQHLRELKRQADTAQTQKEKMQFLGNVVKELKPTRGQKLSGYSDQQLDEFAAALKRARAAELSQQGTKLYSKTRFNQYSDLGSQVVKELQARGKATRAQDLIDTKQLSLGELQKEYQRLVGGQSAAQLAALPPERRSEIKDVIQAYVSGTRALGTAATQAIKDQRDKMRVLAEQLKTEERAIKKEADALTRLSDNQKGVTAAQQAFEQAVGGRSVKDIAALSAGEKANIIDYLNRYQSAIHKIKGDARRKYDKDFEGLQQFRKDLADSISAVSKDSSYIVKRDDLRKAIVKFSPRANQTLQNLTDRRLRDLSRAIDQSINQENGTLGTAGYDQQRVTAYEEYLKKVKAEQTRRVAEAKAASTRQTSSDNLNKFRAVFAQVKRQSPQDYANATGAQMRQLQYAVRGYQAAVATAVGRADAALNAEFNFLLNFVHEATVANNNAKKEAGELDRAAKTRRERKTRVGDATSAFRTLGGFDRTQYTSKSAEEIKQLQTGLELLDKALKGYLGPVKYNLSQAAKRLEQYRAELKSAGKIVDRREEMMARRQDTSYQLGRAAYRASGGNVVAIPQESREDVRAYLEEQRRRAESLRDRAYQSGQSPERVRNLTQRMHELGQAYREVNQEVAHGNPWLHQAGILLNNFLRYAVGYTILYKLIQGFKDLAAAAINLQDDLKGIQAITGTTSSEMVNMKKVIEEVATTSAFKIGDIATAVRTVIQAGVELKDFPKAVKAVSDLATASWTSLQIAADIITTAQAVWDKVSPEEIANKVTQAANVSKLAVEDLQSIFNFGASFAESANINLDQYLNLVAALRNAGRKPSTIGTGLSQLLKELFSPDDKFANYLSNQYLKIGERVSPDKARAKFSGFTDTGDPMQAALQELTRLRANSPESLIGLQRALDQRAVRALTPLLDNPQALIDIQARRTAAPTAAESAAVSMQSLKKASENLRDQLEALADKVLSPMLEPLTDLVTNIGKFADILGKIIDRAEGNERDRGAGGLTTGATIGTGFAGAIAGAAAGARQVRSPVGKIAAGLVGAIAGGTGTYQADRAISAADSSGIGKTIFDSIVIGITSSKIIQKVFNSIFTRAAAASFGTTMAGGTAGGISGLILATGAAFQRWTAKFLAVPAIARLSSLVASPLPPQIKAVLGFFLTLWATWSVFKGFADSLKDPTEKLKDLKNRFTANNPTDLAMQLTEAQMESNRGSTKYGKAYNDQEAPPDSYDRQVAERSKQLSLLTEQARQTFGVSPTQQLSSADVVTQLSDLISFQGSEEGRQALLKQIQKNLGGQGELQQPAVQETTNTAADLITGVNSLREALINKASELETEKVAGTLDRNPEREKEYKAIAEIRSNPQLSWFFDPAVKADIDKTLSVISKIAESGRSAGIKIPEQASALSLEALKKSFQNTADALGTDKQTVNLDALQTYVQTNFATYSEDFAKKFIEFLISEFNRSLTEGKPELGLVATGIIDTVVDSLERKVKQRSAELQKIDLFLKEWKTTGDIVTMVDPKTGQKRSVRDTEAKKLVEDWLPSAIKQTQDLLSTIGDIRAGESPAERSTRFSQQRGAILQGIGEPDLSVKRPMTQEEMFYNLIASAEGATWRTVSHDSGKHETLQDLTKYPELRNVAVGAFQFRGQTWRDFAKRPGAFPQGATMAPDDQMKMAMELIKSVYGSNPFDKQLSEDQIVELVKMLNKKWVSFPGGSQQRFSEADVRAFIRQPKDVLGLTGTGNPVKQGVITQTPTGQLAVNEELVRKSNIEAKNVGVDVDQQIAELSAKVNDWTATIADIDAQIKSINESTVLINDQALRDKTEKRSRERVAELQSQRANAVQVRDDYNRELITKQTNKLGQPIEIQQDKIQEADAESLRKDTAIIADELTSKLQKAVNNQDFFTQRGVIKEELQNNLGLPGNRELLSLGEQASAGALTDLLRTLDAKIAETEALVSKYADQGPEGVRQFGASKERLNQLQNIRLEAKKALGTSERTQQDYDLQIKNLNRQDLETRFGLLTQWRQALAASGRLNEFQGDLADVEKKLLDAENAYLNDQQQRGAISKQRVEDEKARRKAEMQTLRDQADVQNALVQLRYAQEGRYAFSDQQLASQGYRAGTGQAISLPEQRAVAESVYAKTVDAYNVTKDKYDAALEQARNGKTEYDRANAAAQVEGFQAQLGQLAQAAGAAAARLNDLNPSIGGEISQISGASIAAKIAELPQALKHFNENFEGRVVTAMDQMTSAIADAALQMLGIVDSVDNLRQEISDIGDAKLALSDVQSQSLDVARQIEDIKRNESDPARQEYLIKRALDAQKMAEEAARANVQNAQDAYDQAAFDNSFQGKLTAISKELVGGIVTDLIKGTLLQGISGLFGIGQLGSTPLNAMYVKVVPGPEDLLGKAGDAAGSGGWLSKLFGGGSNQDPNFVGPPAPESSWWDSFTGMFSGLGGGQGGWLDSLMGLFSSSGGGGSGGGTGWLDGILSVFSSLGGSGGGGGGGWGSWLSSITSILGMFAGAATGGQVRGPGTTTSDSFLVRASDQEYVLNAKTAAAIGKDTLDAWNFHGKYPMKYATGGMVSPLRQSTNSISPVNLTPTAAPSETEKSMRVILVDDHRRVQDFFNSPSGERTFVDFVRRNNLSLRQALQT